VQGLWSGCDQKIESNTPRWLREWGHTTHKICPQFRSILYICWFIWSSKTQKINCIHSMVLSQIWNQSCKVSRVSTYHMINMHSTVSSLCPEYRENSGSENSKPELLMISAVSWYLMCIKCIPENTMRIITKAMNQNEWLATACHSIVDFISSVTIHQNMPLWEVIPEQIFLVLNHIHHLGTQTRIDRN